MWNSVNIVSYYHKNISIYRVEYTKQTNSACINTQHRGNKTDCSRLWEPQMYVYLCLKSSYSIRFVKPSRHTLIPSKTPLHRSCWRTKKGSNTPEREGNTDSTSSSIYHIRYYLHSCILCLEESLNLV